MKKGLIVSIYRDADGSDCTLDVVSSKVKRLTIIGEGIPQIFEPSEEAPAARIVRRLIAGEWYLHIEPADNDGNALPGWWMFGGNYASTSDSRFPNNYPIGIHDRQEK